MFCLSGSLLRLLFALFVLFCVFMLFSLSASLSSPNAKCLRVVLLKGWLQTAYFTLQKCQNKITSLRGYDIRASHIQKRSRGFFIPRFFLLSAKPYSAFREYELLKNPRKLYDNLIRACTYTARLVHADKSFSIRVVFPVF